MEPLVSELLAAPPAAELGGASTSTRLQLILTAERLIATKGLDAVSLRQVASEAGNANSSAVQYHFGSKEGLVQAILQHRVPRLTQRRRVLLAGASSGGEPLDLRAVLEVFLLPVIEEAEDDDSYYVGFLAQLQQYSRGHHPFDRSPPELQRASRDFLALILTFLDFLPEPIRSNRLAYAAITCTHMAADRAWSRRHDPEGAQLPYALFVADLFDTLLAGLQAPVSPSALRALRGLGDQPDPRLLLP